MWNSSKLTFASGGAPLKNDHQLFHVNLGDRSYDICLGSKLSAELLKPFAEGRTCMVVTDSKVGDLYLGETVALLNAAGAASVATLAFEAGEQSKTLATVGSICQTAALRHLDRKSVIFGLGGGVPGDMAGFAAALYMRGIDFVQLPTSLLAMVDSSIGGKTGCDLPEGKNLIGAFHQPLGVLIAAERLATLPDEEYLCGLAEIIKSAAIMDEPFFAELEANVDKIRSRDDAFTRYMILKTCALKAKIVEMDEREGGIRAILNYGHTFGHALEKVSEFSILHGQGVAAGMCMVLELAQKAGLIPESVVQRQKTLIRNAGLPENYDFDREAVYQALFSDKKALGGKLRFVITPETGKAEIVTFQPELIREYLGI